MEQDIKKSKSPIVLGIISLFAWFIPIIGAPVSIVGIIMSSKSLKQGGALPKVSLALNIIGIIMSVGNFLLGLHMLGII